MLRWFDDARRASSNHVVAARRGRTAWTGEVQQRGSETYRQESSDPANLGLDPAVQGGRLRMKPQKRTKQMDTSSREN